MVHRSRGRFVVSWIFTQCKAFLCFFLATRYYTLRSLLYFATVTCSWIAVLFVAIPGYVGFICRRTGLQSGGRCAVRGDPCRVDSDIGFISRQGEAIGRSQQPLLFIVQEGMLVS
jgi:hypothetical protein